MKMLAYFASLTVLATGIALAQSPGSGSQSDPSNSGVSSSAQSSQSPKMTQTKPSSDPDAADHWTTPATSPGTQTPVPNATIHDQPANPTAPTAAAGQSQPRSGSMGTTGRTPDASGPQSTSPDQQPNSSSTPDNGPPHTSLNEPISVDHNRAPTEILAAMPQKPAHAPDPGTQPVPQATNTDQATDAGQTVTAPAREPERENANGLPQTSSLLPLLGLAGMGSLVAGIFLRGRNF